MAPYFLQELVQCKEATIGAFAVKLGWPLRTDSGIPDLAIRWKQLAKTAPPTAVGRPVARVRGGSLLAGLER